MVKLSMSDLGTLKGLIESNVEKLDEALERTGEVGGMVNIEAPRLVRDVRANHFEFRRILDNAEDVAARAGDINNPQEQPNAPQEPAAPDSAPETVTAGSEDAPAAAINEEGASDAAPEA